MKDEEPGQFSKLCRPKPGLDQSEYFDGQANQVKHV